MPGFTFPSANIKFALLLADSENKKIFHQLLTNFLPSFLSPRQSKNKKFETKSEKKEKEKKGVSKKTFVNQCKNSKQGKQKRGISECVRVWRGQKDFPTNKNC